MKKFLFSVAALGLSLAASAQTFTKGDIVVNAGIGVGCANVTNSQYISGDNDFTLIIKDQTKATFTQTIGVEFGVHDFTDHSALGVGISFNNSYGAGHNRLLTGSYDYSYVSTRYTRNPGSADWKAESETSVNRTGTGNAITNSKIDDFNVMLTVAYHHQFATNLDTYAAIGFGVSRYHYCNSAYSALYNLGAATQAFDPSDPGMSQDVFSYNDIDHVQWQNNGNGGRFVMAAYIGARYYFNDHWGINAELGLKSLSFQQDANNFSIFNFGACYRF